MRHVATRILCAAGAVVLLVCAVGCAPDVAEGEATAAGSGTRQAVEVAAGVPADGVETPNRAGGRSLDGLDAFGLLAPTLPGFTFESYASACDVHEETYGTCL